MILNKPIRVLVVDDEAIINELVQTQLIELGYEVAGGAYDAREAVDMTCNLRPDVVLMDLQMPNPETGQDDRLAGMKAAQEIQERCPTPVILLTAYESPELVEQASLVGVGAYLIKPVGDSDLDRAIPIARSRFGDLMELRRLNADLDAYAHTVAHELKNPLTLILGAADYLAEECETAPREELKIFAYRTVEGARKMKDIINSLLMLAETRSTDVVLKPLDMFAIVGNALERQTYLIREHTARIEVADVWPVALGHAAWVEEVWVNYINNALKYGGRPPALTLGATVVNDGQPKTVRFWVHDNGPGIPETARARLFTPFTRLPNGKVKGHGLGLSIVRRIVEKLSGQVGVESELGVGSTFYFTLPAAGPK
ncbi:MAG: hybrid sensor histidine kinase/response regulator [Anaerolineae bacterium]|nr:hybrid sensor histidine kinase/response regulator [Anaerolineae bacterium]